MRSVGVGIVVAGALALCGPAWANAAKPAKGATSPIWNRDAPADEPIHLIVSVPNQRVDVYVGGKLVANSPVSTGRKSHPTPTGVFSILQKKRHHRSNIYSRAPMPFMQRLTWSGVALHASNQVPDYPASHGCVRLPPEFAKKLFRFTEIGAHVIISGGETTLAEISHPNLFQPAPRHPPAATTAGSQSSAAGTPSIEVASADALRPHDIGAKTQPADAEARNASPVRILVTRRTGRELVRDVQTLLKELGHDPGELDGWMGRDTGAAIVRFQESQGLEKTGAMSDELVEQLYRAAGKGKPRTGHLYVRQDFAPVFDVPIAIADPETPLGSHLFTAMDFDEDASEVRWLAVMLDDPPASQPKDENAEAAPIPTTARKALDRIEIPAGVRRWISRMLTPGSSLAVSDDGISRETLAKGTDFVVLTR
jgi:peptidoglycan hydrolase-like protein with peptidoglycan-binding domain